MRENDVYRTFSLLAMFASRVVHCRRRARAGRCARGVRVGTDDTVCTYHHASFGRHGLQSSRAARDSVECWFNIRRIGEG